MNNAMSVTRRHELECSNATMTDEENDAGYHYCQDWDGMVVGPLDPEWLSCLCPIKGYIGEKG